MIFKAEHIPLVLDGRKTMTRRLGKRRWTEGHIHPVKRDFYSKPVGWVRILSVAHSTLGATTEADALAEGYSSLEGYKAVWERIYKTKWDDDLPVWVITFCPYDGPDPRKQKQSTLF